MSCAPLSEDHWKHILQDVPLVDRLKNCSRVSCTLHRAAAAATQDIYEVLTARQTFDSLCLWMLRHGQHLTRLHPKPFFETLTQLPCQNLLDLRLWQSPVHLGASGTESGVLHSCSRLTKLRLSGCQFSGRIFGLPELRHLELLYNYPRQNSADDLLPGTVLHQLQHLTHLRLEHEGLLTNESLQHISCLTNLQELVIVQESLRRLSLSPSTTQGTSSLTALRSFVFKGGNLDPVVLQDCTLEELVLSHVTISSAGGAAALQLHSLVGRLPQLQLLRFVRVKNKWPRATTGTAAAAYTSLTASSKLQTLALQVDKFPPGVWRHIFSPERQLPVLQVLDVTCYKQWGVHGLPSAAPAALGTVDLSHLASCCPALHELRVCLQPGAQLGALAQLSGLDMLEAEGVDAATLASLTALSGLGSLSIFPGGPILPRDLLCLTALTALTELDVDTNSVPDFMGADDVHVRLRTKRDSPVWLRLLKHCNSFSKCQPLIFNSMGRQLVEQQQQIAVLQQQQQQLAVLQQQQQVAELQEQLAATRVQAAAEAAIRSSCQQE